MPLRPPGSRTTTLLERLPLFAGLSKRDLSRISRLVREVEAQPGKRLASLGETGREMYLIVDGRALVTTRRGHQLHIGPGDYFGEMSLIDGEPRSATVDATTPMRLLVLGYREFWQLMDESLPIVRKVVQTLSKRLRQSEKSPVA